MSDRGVSPTGLAGPGVHALVIGTGTHAPGSVLPEVPAAAETVRRIGAALTGSCGLAEENLHTVIDPADPAAAGRILTVVAAEATRVLLVYFVGHGLISPGGELLLATSATTDVTRGLAAYQALPFSAVCDAIAGSPARYVVVVLDCCHAGLAHNRLPRVAGDAFEAIGLGGGFLLAAAGRSQSASAPPDEPVTAFSGQLVHLLTEGDPAGPPRLTLDHVWRHLSSVLPDRGLPRPHRRTADHAGELVLAANPAYQPPPAKHTGHLAANQAADTSPWPGLRHYTTVDAGLFHGRDRLTSQLVERLGDRLGRPGPQLVVGASGSGKSSLLRAGVLPALAAGALPGSEKWPLLLCKPGATPLSALAAAVAGEQDEEQTRALLDEDPARAAELLDLIRRRSLDHSSATPPERVVLVVDQFEEVFAGHVRADERTAFIAALCAAASEPPEGQDEPRTLVVLALRADFTGHCTEWPRLVDALQQGQFVVGPMRVEELRDVLHNPARQGGLDFEDGLADLLLRDLGAESHGVYPAGRLPLLSHALLSTWQRREGRLLTLAGYRATGGIHDALARTAEQTYAALSAGARKSARRLVLSMVTVGQEGQHARRAVTLTGRLGAREALPPSADEEALNALAGARLITTGHGIAELTHDALLVHWPRLRKWIDEDRGEMLVRQRLADDAKAWSESDEQDPSFLYQGARLEAARTAGAPGHRLGPLTSTEQEFLLAGIRRSRRSTRRAYQVVATLTVLLLVAVSLLIYARGQTADAEKAQAELAGRLSREVSLQLAAEADALRATRPVAALERGLLAYGVAETQEARAGLIATLTQTTGPAAGIAAADPKACVQCPAGPRAVLAANGRILAVTDVDDTTVSLWDITDRASPKRRSVINTDFPVTALAFSPDSGTLAVASRSQDRNLVLWSVQAPDDPSVSLLAGPLSTVSALAFSRDGHRLAAADASLRVTVFEEAPAWRSDVRTQVFSVDSEVTAMAFAPHQDIVVADANGSTSFFSSVAGTNYSKFPFPPLLRQNGPASALALSEDGRHLAIGGQDAITLWHLPSGRFTLAPVAVPLTGHTGAVQALAFSRDGRSLAAAGSGADRTVTLWRVQDQGAPTPVRTATGHFGDIPGLAFSPDGRTLVTASTDHTTKLWDVDSSGHGTEVASVKDRTATLWQAAQEAQPRPVATLGDHEDRVTSVAFSPDNQSLITGSADHKAIIWQAEDDGTAPTRAATLNDHHGPISGVVFGTGMVATASKDGDVRTYGVHDRSKPLPLARLQPKSPVNAIALADGMIAAGTDNGEIHRWSTDGSPAPVTRAHTSAVLTLASMRYGQMITGSADRTVRWWFGSPDSSMTTMMESAGHTDKVTAVAYSDGAEVAVTAAADGLVALWDMSTRKRTETLSPHLGAVRSVALDRAGGTLVIAGDDGTAALWAAADSPRPQSQRCCPERWKHPARTVTIKGHKGAVLAVAFSPDGNRLVTAGEDRTARLWDMRELRNTIDRPIERACALIGTEVSDTVLRRYTEADQGEISFRSPCPKTPLER